MTIRSRLTLVTAGLVAATLFVFSVMFYWVLSATLLDEADRTLERFTLETHRALGHTDGSSWLSHTVAVNLEALPVNDFSAPGVYVQVLDDRGALLAVSSNLAEDQLPRDQTSIAAGLAGGSWTAELTAPSGERLRVLTTPVLVDDRPVGLVQVAQSLYSMDDTLGRVRLLLVVGVVLATNLAGAAGYVVAARVLAPVTSMALAAERIAGGQDLDQRILPLGSRDELDMLAGALNSMLARLQAAFRGQQDFVADSSHELRTPLTIIRGNLDLLARSGDPKERAECVAAIERESARMTDLVNDLLLLARLQGAPPPVRATVDLDAVTTDVYRALKPLAGGRSFRLGPVEALQTEGDEDQIRRMLLNLAENALKYTPEGGQVTISCVARTSGASRKSAIAYLTVTNTGPGIPAGELPRIFDRFHRVAGGAGASSGGTGLGLAIARAVAQAHGGDISVASSPGQETTFSVKLPLFDS